MILDATCSFAHVWPAYATLRMDIRREVGPDLVADARFLPFRDGVFDEIFLDPPHIFGRCIYIHDKMDRYGSFKNGRAWKEFAKSATAEAARVLAPGGSVHYKITETEDSRLKVKHIPTDSLQISRHRITKSKSNRTDKFNVHWLTMKPTPAHPTPEAASP